MATFPEYRVGDVLVPIPERWVGVNPSSPYLFVIRVVGDAVTVVGISKSLKAVRMKMGWTAVVDPSLLTGWRHL